MSTLLLKTNITFPLLRPVLPSVMQMQTQPLKRCYLHRPLPGSLQETKPGHPKLCMSHSLNSAAGKVIQKHHSSASQYNAENR